MGEPEPVKLDGVRIAGLQFLPSGGGISLLVPQEVIDILAKLGVKQRTGGPSLSKLVVVIKLLDQQVHVLTGVRICTC